jgi:Plasmid recombination enzyme
VLRQVAGHNHRLVDTPNADPDRQADNQVLVGTTDVEADVRSRIEAAGLDPTKLRRNGVIAVELLYSASPEFFRPNGEGYGEYDPDRLEAWKTATVAHLQKRWGSDRIANAVLHLDESTPHIQAVVIPLDTTPRKKGAATRLNAAKWFDGSPKLQQRQDEYHQDVAHLGLERGVRGSKAKHQAVRRAYAEIADDVARAWELRQQAEEDRAAATREREMAARDREMAAKERTEAQKTLAEASEAQRRADAAQKAAEATQKRADGLLKGVRAVGSGAIIDGKENKETGKRAFVFNENITASERKTLVEWIGPEALNDVWLLARRVANEMRKAMAPIEALMKRAEGLNKKLDTETKSKVSSLSLALEVMNKRLGHGK